MKPIEEWTGRIHQGNTLDLLKKMAEDSVDMIFTSPPYYGLRAYGKETEVDWPDGWHGQLGLEPTVELYVEHLMLIVRELKRVLKPTGSFYLNIGDTYSSSLGPHGGETAGLSSEAMVGDEKRPPVPQGPSRGRLLIPSRVALRMQEEGWSCMDEIIWRKPNHMPSSVKSRLANSWEPIFRFVKNGKTLLWRVMRNHGEYRAGAWLREKPNTPYREYLLERDWGGDKAGEWVAEKPPKLDGKDRIWERSRTNWLGFSFYYELDAIREPHKTSTHARGPDGSMVAPRLSNKMPTQQDTREASLAYGLGSKVPSQYVPDPRGVPPDDVVPTSRFNIRVRDAKEGRLEAKWGERVGATEEEIEAYDEKRYGGFHGPREQLRQKEAVAAERGREWTPRPDSEYSGKFLEDPEAVNSPRARMARPGYDPASFYAEGGRNPGDTIQVELTEKKWAEVPGQATQTIARLEGHKGNQAGHPLGKTPDDIEEIEDTKGMNVPGQEPQHGLRVPGHQGDWSHESGKNPADVADPDGFPLNPPHTAYATRRHVTGSMYPPDQQGHPEGKNPGDVQEAQEEIKERIGDAHGGWATTHLYMPHVTHHELGKNPSDVTETPKYEEAVRKKTEGRLQLPTGSWPGNSQGWWKVDVPRTTHDLGKTPDDVMEHRDKGDERHRLDHLSLPPEPEVDPGRAFGEGGKNPGDTVEGSETVYVKTRPSAGTDPRAGNEDRLSEARGHGGWKGNNLVRADGKNPGDTQSVPAETRTLGAITGERGAVKVPGGQGWTGHWPGGGARIYGENDPRWLSPEGKNPQDFWSITTQPFKDAHFAVFPLGICWNPILSSSPPDGVILDPFAGSGTVAEAVELVNILGSAVKDREAVALARQESAEGQRLLEARSRRTWIMLEISPKYCEIAEKRLRPYR